MFKPCNATTEENMTFNTTYYSGYVVEKCFDDNLAYKVWIPKRKNVIIRYSYSVDILTKDNIPKYLFAQYITHIIPWIQYKWYCWYENK